MKDILKYSYKYLTFEVIQGIRIFQILYACVGGGGGGGGYRTTVSRVEGDNSTTELLTHLNDRLYLTRVYFLISRYNLRIVSIVKI